jgi:hypothetical protein
VVAVKEVLASWNKALLEKPILVVEVVAQGIIILRWLVEPEVLEL